MRMASKRQPTSCFSVASKLKKSVCTDKDETSKYSLNEEIIEVPGRIASVELFNFMCHENLKISFDLLNKNCFFIGGSNGSGKSALFAALNMGLGGRGSQNERGSTMKQYIKDGQNRAKIRIVLTNRGFGRYPGYGDAIAVERTINLTSSTYQLKSLTYEEGRCREEVISHKKSDLDKLLARFSIQLDNSIFWMSQNRCREFLQELKPEKLYNMFMSATGLDFSRLCYSESETYNAESEKLVLSVRQACCDKLKEIEKLREDRKRAQNMEQNKQNLLELKSILPWLPIRDCHKDLCRHNELLAKAVEVYTKLKEGFVVKEKMKADYLKKFEQIQKNKDELQEKVKNLHIELRNLGKEKKSRRDEMLDVGQQLSTVERNHRILDAEIGSMEQQLKEIEAKKNQGTQYSIAEAEAELFHLENRCMAMKEKQCRVEKRTKYFETELANAIKVERSVEAEISHWNAMLRELCDEKERLMAMQRSDLARFGTSVPQIVSLIKQNIAKFSKQPIGPIGAYIRINDESWALAVEYCLRHLLSVWLCDNVQDRNILDSILQKYNIRAAGYIISKFSERRYNITLFEPSSEYLTVARMVTVTDDNIFNVLVDQTQMESILLIPSASAARSLMAQSPPKNVHKGFTKNGDEVFAKMGNQVYRFYANERYQKSTILTSNEIANTRTLNDQIAKAENELRSNRVSLAKAQEKRQKIEADMTNEMQQSNQELQRLKVDEVRRRSLQKRLDAARFEGGVDGQVMNLVSSLDQYRREKEKLMQSESILQQQLIKSRQLLRDAEMVRAEKAREMGESENELRKSEADLQECSREVDMMNVSEDEHRQKLSKLEIHKSGLEEKVKALNEKLQKMKEEANELITGAPPDFANLPDTAEAEERCRKLEHRIQAARESLEGTIVSEEALDALQNDCESLRKKYKNAKRVVLELKNRLRLRNEKFLEVRNLTAERLSELYSGLMSIRNFKGSLIINHENRAIYIMAETQKNQEINQVSLLGRYRGKGNLQDLRGLSGGERTYTSACFVMALWQAMETPIRCMDEFDVFLDLNNRKIVMELFADLATRQYPSYQFIFFTPQGVADFARRDRIQLFEMPKIRE
ncbi:RecF/RecN/SMC N terminal domain family protein [Acanthocheilonema viteae]